MAGNTVNRDDDDVLIRFDVLWATLHSSRRWILGLALSVTALVATLAFVYLVWIQPVRTVATLSFSPTFKGASEQVPVYPNGVPFSQADVLGGNVLDAVFTQNKLEDFCPLDRFKSSFFVDRQSAEAAFLASDYESRLADSRLTIVERDRLEAEYQSKRQALPLDLRLVFAEPPECGRLPETLIRKAMSDTLARWADESQRTRGVLALPVPRFLPESFDVSPDAGPRFVRADLIRSQLTRMMAAADEAMRLPGAATVRLASGDSLPAVRARLADEIHLTEPLLAAASQSSGQEGLRWAQLQLASAETRYRAAQGQENVYRQALADYTAQAMVADPSLKMSSRSTLSASELVPQFDQSFLTGLMALSVDHVKYRQELTERMAAAGLEAEPYRAPVLFYQSLVDAVSLGQRSVLTGEQIDARLDAVVSAGKALTDRFNGVIDEIARVTLDAASGLYRTAGSAQVTRERAFTPKLWGLLVALTFVVTLILSALWAVVRGRLRAIVTV